MVPPEPKPNTKAVPLKDLSRRQQSHSRASSVRLDVAYSHIISDMCSPARSLVYTVAHRARPTLASRTHHLGLVSHDLRLSHESYTLLHVTRE